MPGSEAAAGRGEDRRFVGHDRVQGRASRPPPQRLPSVGAIAVDVDHVVEERLGKPIDRVFAEDGEAAFEPRRSGSPSSCSTRARGRDTGACLVAGGGIGARAQGACGPPS